MVILNDTAYIRYNVCVRSAKAQCHIIIVVVLFTDGATLSGVALCRVRSIHDREKDASPLL